MRKCSIQDNSRTAQARNVWLTDSSGCDPLTPDDIAEVVVFVAGRRQNVVIADTLIFPSHQVSPFSG